LGGRLSAAATKLPLRSFRSFFFHFSIWTVGTSNSSSSSFLLLKATAYSLTAWLVARSRSFRMVFGLTFPIRWTSVSHVVPSSKVVMPWLSAVLASSAQHLVKWWM
jgi:hypothetical protein